MSSGIESVTGFIRIADLGLPRFLTVNFIFI